MQFITNCKVICNCTPYCTWHVLQFVRVGKKINEEEERATLKNFVDSFISELLRNNETED